MCDFATSSAIQTTSQDNSPQWLKDFYQGLARENTSAFNTAKGIYNANQNYQPYTGARVQQFSADQLNAMQRLRDTQGMGTDALKGATQSIGLGSRSTSDAMPVDANAVSGMYQAYLGRTPSASEIQFQLKNGPKNVAELQAGIARSPEAAQKAASGYRPDLSKLQDGSFHPNSVQTENYNQSYQQGQVNPNTAATALTYGAAPMVGGAVSRDPDRFGTNQAQAYMNPYTDTVMRNTLGEMGRQNAIGQQGDAAKATASKAFGGSRQGVVEAERARNFAQEQNNVIGNLQNQNFAQAQNQFNTDTSRLQQNQQANMGVNLQSQMANQGATMQTLMGDAAARNSMNQFNAGILNNSQLANEQLRQSAFGINRDTFNQNQDRQFATQVQNQNMGLQGYNANRDQFNTDQSRLLQGGAMGLQNAALQQQMNMQDINNLMMIGGQQQNLAQRSLDTGYQDFLNQRQYPYQQYNFLQSALQGNSFNPYQGISGTTTTQQGGDPSAIQQAAGLGLAAYGMFGGF
jgi:hypothetical protein